MSIKKYFLILELSESADLSELNEHYRIKIKQFHPDLFADDPAKQREANEKTKEINCAYTELKKILPKKSVKKIAVENTEENISKNNDSSIQFDILGFISNFFLKLIKKDEPRSIIKNVPSENNSKKNARSKPQFNEVLKNKMNAEHQTKSTRTSYSSIYRELQRKRALYGNRQKEGANEKGPISPISPVQGIRNNRIQ